MAHIAILGLGNWGTAIARMWLADNHRVKGWTIEQEVYESITMDSVNAKYLPNHPVEGLEATMHIEEALEGVEIIVLAVPSSVILGVVDQIIPHLRPGHVLLDLAKGLADGNKLISEAIQQKLNDAGKSNTLAVVTGPTIAPEAASGGVIGLVNTGDIITIDIPSRSITLDVPEAELEARRVKQDALGWKPENRQREVSFALKAYASMATSADKGAVRDKSKLEG